MTKTTTTTEDTTKKTCTSTSASTSTSTSSSTTTTVESAVATTKQAPQDDNTTSKADGGSENDDNAPKEKPSKGEGEGQPPQDTMKMLNNKFESSSKPKICTKPIYEQTYWDSTDARKLFNSRDDEEDAKVSLERRLVKLKKAMETPTSYQTLIDVKPEYVHLLNDNEIEAIKNKIMYLSILLQLAIDNMNVKKSWSQCCEETVKYMKNHYTLLGGTFGFTPLSNAGSLRRLFNSFRKDDRIVLSADGALLEKRIQKHLEKKRKLEEKHKAWVQRGWARNAKLKKLEKKIETIKEDQKKKKEEDDDEETEGDDYLSARDYELMMRY